MHPVLFNQVLTYIFVEPDSMSGQIDIIWGPTCLPSYAMLYIYATYRRQ